MKRLPFSAGDVRRVFRPLFMRLWLRHVRDRELHASLGDLKLTVLPTVFHPRFFGSSRIFAEYLSAPDLTGKRFLDMGTGCGIVGLMAARSGASVTAVDINPRAVECAAINFKAAGLQSNIRLSDLFSSLEGQTFDIVAWNPPFFPKQPQGIAEVAWYAGENHETIRRFAQSLPRYLAPSGKVFIILSGDLSFRAWSEIFVEAGFTMREAQRKRWGLETMTIYELRQS